MLQQIVFVSQSEAESMLPGQAWAIVSITDPDANTADLHDGWAAVLRLAFDDVDPRIDELDVGDMTPLSEPQALAIAQFYQRIATHCRVLVVHCRYGQSRSAAIARALCEVRGLDVPVITYGANRYVYELVKRSLTASATN